MRRRQLLTRIGVIPIAIAMALVASPLRAWANHDQSTYYHRWWHTGDRTVTWHFDNDYPTGNKRDRVKDGAGKWNQQNQSMSFSFNSTDTSDQVWGYCSSSTNMSTVFWFNYADPPGTDALGVTYTCVYSGDATRIKHFYMVFDTGNSWYAGTATDPPGNSDIDLWSVATHEMGHATGLGTAPDDNDHFQGGVCTSPPSNTDQTMCAIYVADATWVRSLESHDKGVFGDRY